MNKKKKGSQLFQLRSTYVYTHQETHPGYRVDILKPSNNTSDSLIENLTVVPLSRYYLKYALQ